MRVEHPNLRSANFGYEVAATVRFASGAPEFVARIGLPLSAASFIAPRLDGLLPSLALVAVAIGEDLEVDVPVDPILLDGLRRLIDRRAERTGRPPIQIHAAGVEVLGDQGGRSMLLYTQGLDSTYSLLVLRDELDCLLYVTGLDPAWSTETHAAVVARAHAAAERHSLPLHVVTCNLREPVDRYVPFNESHHAVLCAPVLAMAHGIDRCHLAGGNVGLEALWEDCSVTGTSLRLHESSSTRYHKARVVARSPAAVRSIRVCWEHDSPSNCGECLKCLMTAAYLAAVADYDDVLQAFPARALDPDHVRQVAPGCVSRGVGAIPPDQVWRTSGWTSAVRNLSKRHPELAAVWSGLTAELAGGFPPAVVGGDDPATGLDASDRVAATGARTARTEVRAGWVSGHLPLRPRGDASESVRRACRAAESRSVPWAYVGPDHPDVARCLDAAAAAWGPGLVHIMADDDAGACLEERDRHALLSRARVRLVLGDDGEDLMAGPILGGLEHGCLPLQVVAPEALHRLAAQVPDGMDGVLVSLDGLAGITEDDIATRLARVLGVVLAGSLERDLAEAGCRV